MKKIKTIYALAMLLSLGSLVSCGSSNEEEFVIWSFTDELKTMVNDYYVPNKNKDLKVRVQTYTVDAMANKLTLALRSKKELPDMVGLEAGVVKRFTNSGCFVNLDNLLTNDVKSDTYQYTRDITTANDGHVYGLSWQATPGAYFYRSDLAKTYLGVNNPEEMQAKINTWAGFYNTAIELKNASMQENGSYKRILSSLEEPVKVFLSQRSQPWVVEENGAETLKIDPILYNSEDPYNCMQLLYNLQNGVGADAKCLVNENCEGERSTVWFNDMKSGNILGYFCTSWSYYYDLKSHAGETAGKWAMCEGPASYYKGGTWLSALNTSKKQDIALDMIKYFTTDKEFLTSWQSATGDFMNSKSVMNAIKDTHEEAFLGGQKYLSVLYDNAEKIDGSLITQYDSRMNSLFTDAAAQYALQIDNDYKTITTALHGFSTTVASSYPNINVEL